MAERIRSGKAISPDSRNAVFSSVKIDFVVIAPPWIDVKPFDAPWDTEPADRDDWVGVAAGTLPRFAGLGVTGCRSTVLETEDFDLPPWLRTVALIA